MNARYYDNIRSLFGNEHIASGGCSPQLRVMADRCGQGLSHFMTGKIGVNPYASGAERS